jgi:hypothetical protein
MDEYGVGYHHDNSGVVTMHRTFFIAAVLIAALPSAPSFAVTAKEKAATCKFGADDQKLAGAARAKFMKNCLANKNDPRGGAGGGGAAGGVPPPPKN